MTRLEFAVAVFVLASPAGAARRAPMAMLMDPAAAVAADADARDAAQRLFADPVERETFYYRMAADPALAQAVKAALRQARADGGGDDGAVTQLLKSAGTAWQGDVAADVGAARKTLETGLGTKPPKTDYPETPLIAHLVSSLHKQNAAGLFAAINRPEYGGPLPAKPEPAPAAPAKPCVPGGSAALDQLRAADRNGAAGFTGGPCPQDPAAPTGRPAVPPGPSTARPTLTAGPAPISDQHPKTGAPPPPGAGTDKAATPAAGGGFSFGVTDAVRTGAMAGFGALIGSIGGPGGMLVGALLGGLIGAFLLKGGGNGDG